MRLTLRPGVRVALCGADQRTLGCWWSSLYLLAQKWPTTLVLQGDKEPGSPQHPCRGCRGCLWPGTNRQLADRPQGTLLRGTSGATEPLMEYSRC